MRSLIFAVILLFTASCSTVSNVVQHPEKAPLSLSNPSPVTFDPLHWHIVTANNQSYVGLSTEEFQILITDLANVDLYIRQLNSEVGAYKQYYEPSPPIKTQDNK